MSDFDEEKLKKQCINQKEKKSEMKQVEEQTIYKKLILMKWWT
jgi:hypothetical protein